MMHDVIVYCRNQSVYEVVCIIVLHATSGLIRHLKIGKCSLGDFPRLYLMDRERLEYLLLVQTCT